MTASRKAADAKPEKADDDVERADGGYVVKVARVQASLGDQVLQFAQGDVLPKGIADKDLDRLAGRGLIEKN